MKYLLTAVLAMGLLAVNTSVSFAEDPTVSPLCRGDAAKDHVNYCNELAQGSLLTPQRFDDKVCDEAKKAE